MAACEEINPTIQFQRLHTIQKPLSDYIQYEFYSYLVSEKTGEDIRCTFEANSFKHDFVLFDEQDLFILDFSSKGELLGCWYCARNFKNEKEFSKLIVYYQNLFNKALNFKKIAQFDQGLLNKISEFL